MKYKNKITKIAIEVGPPAKGHYVFQGGKTTFDNRPKRLRTRATQKKEWSREYA